MSHIDATHAAARPEVAQREDVALMNVPRQGLPSEVVPPTEVGTPTQQGATQPGSGSVAHDDERSPTRSGSLNVNESGKVPWKDQVLGYAKKTRGSILRNTDTKESGHAIVKGEVSMKDALNK